MWMRKKEREREICNEIIIFHWVENIIHYIYRIRVACIPHYPLISHSLVTGNL